jgi:hypothetical protein
MNINDILRLVLIFLVGYYVLLMTGFFNNGPRYNRVNGSMESSSTMLTDNTKDVRAIDVSNDTDKMYELSDEKPYAEDVDTESYTSIMPQGDHIPMSDGATGAIFDSVYGMNDCKGAPLEFGTFANPYGKSKCGTPAGYAGTKVSHSEYCEMMCSPDPDASERKKCYNVCMERKDC